MEMSVREARAHFAQALAAAERGERVTITKNGKPLAEIGPPTASTNTFSWDRLESWRCTNELDKLVIDPKSDAEWLDDFDALDSSVGMTDPLIDPDER